MGGVSNPVEIRQREDSFWFSYHAYGFDESDFPP